MKADAPIIMIVDDVPASVSFLFDVLDEAGYTVLISTDGYRALEQLTIITPDLMLLDAVMPGMDGFQMCRRLHSDGRTREIPVIFMTGLTDTCDLVRGFKEGAVDYIVKPVNPDELLARIDTHLGTARRIRRVHELLNSDSLPAIAVDADGAVVWMMKQAQSLLESYFDPFECTGQNPALPKTLGHWVMEHLTRMTEPSQPFVQYRYGRSLEIYLRHNARLGGAVLHLKPQAIECDAPSLTKSLNLTPREAEVLHWVSNGKTNPEIGIILGISSRTVNKHLDHVYEKLGVETRTAAAAMALKQFREI